MRRFSFILLAAVLAAAVTVYWGSAVLSQALPDYGEDAPVEEIPSSKGQGPMTLERMNGIILRVDENARRSEAGNGWQFTVEDVAVNVVADTKHDRMRIVVGIAQAGTLSDAMLRRLMQANFDTALDARYAIAQNILWGTFIHPLSVLTDRQLLSGIGQTVNLARTYGTTFSSGELSFGGGDSQDLLERELIDRLLEKETPI